MISSIRQYLFAFFPVLIFLIFVNLFFNGQRIQLDNVTSVLSVFILCVLLINKETFLINKNTVFILLFYLFFFLVFFAENMFILLRDL